jgi:hypothetical protein
VGVNERYICHRGVVSYDGADPLPQSKPSLLRA